MESCGVDASGETGIWAYYPIDDERVLIAGGIEALKKGIEDGSLRI